MLDSLLVVAVGTYVALLVLLRLSESRLLYFPGPRGALLQPPPALGPAGRARRAPHRGRRPAGQLGHPRRSRRAMAPHLPRQRRQHLRRGPAPALCRAPCGRAQPLRLRLSRLRGKRRHADRSRALRGCRDGLPLPARLARRAARADRDLRSLTRLGRRGRARRPGPAAGLILDGALTSVPDRAAEIYPFFPVRWLSRSRYASLAKIGELRFPKLFLHAER